MSEKDWPAGMPNPDLPWPWQTDAERERRLRLPYWKDRFQQQVAKYPGYAQWIPKP